jgi:putative ABC transport system permease protein
MSAFTQDIRYGLRLLAKNPGFTAASVLCLGLGIGATTAIFSVVNAVLLRQLPYHDSARMVRVFTEFPTLSNGGLRHFWMSPPEYLDLKRDTHSFDAIEGWATQGVNLAGADQPVRATAAYVTGGMLKMLGVAPHRGRILSADDDRPNTALTAVLSYNLWQRAYGGDASILGRDIRFNGNPCTVVGVMPPGFAFPPGELDPPELWVPVQIDPARPGNRGGHFLSILARLAPGTGLPQAAAEMNRYMNQPAAPNTHAFNPKFHTLVIAGFQEEIVRRVSRSLWVLMSAVGFVLLIACVNVANLLLARAEARRREIAVRTAIGAGAVKMLRQFVTEGVLLSLAGAALGMLVAFGGLRVLAATNAGSIPRAEEIGINWQVLLFTLAVSVATGVGFGLAPMIHTRAGALHDTLKAAAGRTTASAAGGRFRAVLVTSELALALVLLIGSGLMIKAFWKLQDIDAGIDPSHLLTMRVALPNVTYRDAAAVTNFYGALRARLKSLPGVASASIAGGLPPSRPINANDTFIEGLVPVPGGPQNNIDYWNSVTPGYFETVRARLREGRFLNEGDGATAPLVVVVNETMARTYWPNQSALGHRLRTPGPSNSTPPWRTVVGVLADIKNAALDRPAGTEVFFPFDQGPGGRAQSWVIVRAQGDPMSLAGAVRNEIRNIDRALPVASVGAMEDVMAAARSRPRFLTLLLTMFSSLSLILAALGIYGVISYAVVQRTNEIGIRMALGAQGGDVLRLIGTAGVRLALAGTIVGAVGAVVLTRFMGTLLYEVSSFDPLTFIAMAAALIAVTLVACYIPARRAAKVDPLIALRYE